jgi:hypothetical protein
MLEEAENLRAEGLAEVAEEREKGLAEVAEERAKGLADIDARRGELVREREAMQTHQEKQEGHVELNIGGYRFQTSVQTLRRVPHTYYDAYFSGRYAQDVCDDGSIFVDRDGEHFGHVLEHMRDGVVSVTEEGASPSVSLLRVLKREFGFYCIELNVEHEVEPEQSEVAYAMVGIGDGGGKLSSMDRYDASSGQWSEAAAMGTARWAFGACVVVGELYVIGGQDNDNNRLSSVRKYTPSTDTWSAVVPLPASCASHVAVAVGVAMSMLGRIHGDDAIAICSNLTARKARGVKWRPCLQRDTAWLLVPSGATSTFLAEVLAAKIRHPSSNSTRRPTSGAPWRPCPLLAIVSARVCWAA